MLGAGPATATKAQLLDMIFEELGRASYDLDRTPDEDISALRKVDALMGEWRAQGCDLNYNFPATFGKGKPTDLVGIPDAAMNTVAAWAAFRHAPGIGKTMSAESRKAMADGKSFLFAETATIPSMDLPSNTARGIGNKPFSIWRPFSPSNLQASLTLAPLVLSDAAAVVGVDYAATFGPITQGAQIVLISDAGGIFTIKGNILQASALAAGTYAPVIRQILPGAVNSPVDTALTVIAA